MGQNTSQPTSDSVSDRGKNQADSDGLPAFFRESELQDVVSATHAEVVVNVDGVPSINFGLEDIFSYTNYAIPELNGKSVWTFKVHLQSSGQAEVELRLTDDLTGVTALSYTWGAKLRPHRSQIGVYTSGSPCEVMLGHEWFISEVISVLAQLSADSWLWMDQIAKQPGLTSKDVIATFPTVYSRCNVVVLLPGPNCQYANSLKDRCLETGSLTYPMAMQVNASFIEHAVHCDWYTPKVRWYSRVWTRQEALYARRLRIVHVGGAAGACIPVNAGSPDTTYESLWLFRGAMINLAEVLGTKMNAPDTMTENVGIQVAQGLVAQAALLLGLQLTFANNTPPLSKSLSRLAETDRKTTEPVDLILSVWPGVNFSTPINNWRPADWRTAYADMARYYETRIRCVLPHGIVKGATEDATVGTLEESPLVQMSESRTPTVRSLYSRFQYLQAGAPMTAEGKPYLQVLHKRVTLQSFPLLDNPRDAIKAIASYTNGLPAWVIRVWWRKLLNAQVDSELELLDEFSTELEILFHILVLRLQSPRDAGRPLDTNEAEENYKDATISGTRMAGLLVMCATGTWGVDPNQLARCAALVSIDGSDRICAGWPGTYQLGFGQGNGDLYGCVMTESGEVYVRAVIPVPYHLSQFGRGFRNNHYHVI